jgi:hypothetical protein
VRLVRVSPTQEQGISSGSSFEQVQAQAPLRPGAKSFRLDCRFGLLSFGLRPLPSRWAPACASADGVAGRESRRWGEFFSTRNREQGWGKDCRARRNCGWADIGTVSGRSEDLGRSAEGGKSIRKRGSCEVPPRDP